MLHPIRPREQFRSRVGSPVPRARWQRGFGNLPALYAAVSDVWERIPAHHKKFIREKKIRVYFADMVQIARDVASVADLQMRMQGIVLLGAFLKLTPYGRNSGMTDDQVHAGVEKAIRKYFGKRGDRVVQDNMTCIKRGYSEVQEVTQQTIQAG